MRPISTYCADVWGAFLKKQSKIFDIMNEKYSVVDDYCFEKTDLQFAKSILGVHRKASNAAVRGELGRYPMIIFILKQVIKNWFRVVNCKRESLLFDTYLCNFKMVYDGKACWLNNIRTLLCDTLGLKHIWDNQGSIKKGQTYL